MRNAKEADVWISDFFSFWCAEPSRSHDMAGIRKERLEQGFFSQFALNAPPVLSFTIRRTFVFSSVVVVAQRFPPRQIRAVWVLRISSTTDFWRNWSSPRTYFFCRSSGFAAGWPMVFFWGRGFGISDCGSWFVFGGVPDRLFFAVWRSPFCVSAL